MEVKIAEMKKMEKGLGGLLRSREASRVVKNAYTPGGGVVPKEQRLSSKDIVGGVVKFDENAEAPVGAPPPKKGKLWESYQNYLKEQEEDHRRKLEVWQAAEQRRQEEAKKQMLASKAGGGR